MNKVPSKPRTGEAEGNVNTNRNPLADATSNPADIPSECGISVQRVKLRPEPGMSCIQVAIDDEANSCWVSEIDYQHKSKQAIAFRRRRSVE